MNINTNVSKLLTKLKRIYMNDNELRILQTPINGEWTLHRQVSMDWTINVTGQTEVDFDSAILTNKSGGFLYALQYNPIAGKTS